MHRAHTDRTGRGNTNARVHTHTNIHTNSSQYSIEQVDKLSGRIQNIICVWICLEAGAKIRFNMKLDFVRREQKNEDACKQAQC